VPQRDIIRNLSLTSLQTGVANDSKHRVKSIKPPKENKQTLAAILNISPKTTGNIETLSAKDSKIGNRRIIGKFYFRARLPQH